MAVLGENASMERRQGLFGVRTAGPSGHAHGAHGHRDVRPGLVHTACPLEYFPICPTECTD